MGLKAYLRLARLQTSGVTALAPLLGFLAAGYAAGRPMDEGLANVSAVVLLIVWGVAAHVFGFVHNEIADREVDKKAAYRRPKPLSTGEISLKVAWAMAVGGLAGGLGIALWVSLYSDIGALLLAGASVAFAVLYNTKGKAVVGGDVFLAVSIGLFVLAGGAAYGGLEKAVAPAVLGPAALAGLIVFFNNAFEGGYKDHATDKEAGKRTLVLALRVRGEKLASPDGLLVFAQIPIHLAFFLAAAWMLLGPLRPSDPWQGLLLTAFAAALAAGMTRFYTRGIAQEERKRMLGFFARHEGAALVLLLLPFLFHVSPLAWAILFASPLLVFLATNKALYGTTFSPDV